MVAVLCIILSLLATTPSQAFERKMSVAEVLTQTDVVVVGNLVNVKEWTTDNIDYGMGTIEVTETLLGNIPITKKITLKWSNRRYQSERVEYKATNGVKFVWLLWRAQDGTFRAPSSSMKVNHDQRGDVVRNIKNIRAE